MPMGHRTVDGQIAESCACSSLDLDIAALEKNEDGLEGSAVDFTEVSSLPSARAMIALRCKSTFSE